MLMKAWCNEREEGGGREGKYSKKVREIGRAHV